MNRPRNSEHITAGFYASGTLIVGPVPEPAPRRIQPLVAWVPVIVVLLVYVALLLCVPDGAGVL